MRLNIQHGSQSSLEVSRISAATRRGAVLLVVLSMLFMFAIMVLTFVMVTSRYRQASKMYVQAEQRREDPELLANRVLMQMIRGPRDPLSPYRFHDLLGDVYSPGREFAVLQAWIPAPSSDVDDVNNLGQLLVLRIRDEDNGNFFKNQAEADFGGRVITMLGGPFSGMSTRSVHLRKVYVNGNAANEAYLVIRMFDMPTHVDHELVRSTFLTRNNGEVVGEGSPTGPASPGLLAGHHLWMNGATFVGSGTDEALRPNYARTGVVPDQLNEPYDAADNQNFLLSFQYGDGANRVIPSMHRPALLNYMFNQIPDRTDPSQIMAMIESVTVRPVPMYYEDASGNIISRNVGFSGTHPGYQTALEVAQQVNGIAAFNLADPDQVRELMTLLISGVWDVDNKGDGIPDSVWTDPQLPVMSTKDGRRYKVLIAPRVEGLDGRVNINASANWAQLTNRYDVDLNTGGYDTIAKLPNGANATNGPNRLAQGRGYGPAEINLKPLLNGSDVQKRKNIAELLMLRYGVDRMPGSRGSVNAPTGADVRSDDALIQYSHIGLPGVFGEPASGTQYYGFRTNPSAYGTPPDVFGRGFHALSHAGHPFYAMAGQVDNLRDDLEEIFSNQELINWFGQWPLDIVIDERTENPYQVDLLQDNVDDDLFTLQDLELLLRRRDLDTTLKRGRLDPMAAQSELVTTHSYEIPSVPRMRDGVSLARRMRNRVRAALPNTATDEDIDNVLHAIMPFELYRGNRLNINRLFGNGRDDQVVDSMGNVVRDRDGIVDNLDEIFDPSVPASETVYRYFGAEVKPFYADSTDPRMGRLLLARHIYCMLLEIFPVNDANLRPDASLISHQQWLAQWAVNVVDYRDSDATYTIFEFDTQPFDGWDVDGDIGTDEGANRGFVIGMERPDLLLTETFAYHDRRVKDTPWDTSLKSRDQNDETKEDKDLDQYRIPESGLFLELFAARNRLTEDAVVPGDLYDLPTGALDLGRLAGRYFDRNGDPQFATSADGTVRPVWRVVVADRQKSQDIRANNGHNPALMLIDETDIEREVWFTTSDPQDLGMSPQRAARVYWSTAVAGLLPGQYGVVGPRPISIFGSRTGGPQPPNAPEYRPSPYGIDMTYALGGVLTLRPGLPQTPPVIDDPSGGSNKVLRDTLPSVPIIVQGKVINNPNVDQGWNGNERVGVSVTEPLPYEGVYYRKPTHRLAMGFPLDSYYDASAMQGALPDVPFDQSSVPNPLPTGFTARDARPLRQRNMLKTQTYSNAYDNAIYLQRVADPSRPWDPARNPYITVDSMDLDVTVFNGEDDNHDGSWTAGGSFDQFSNGTAINDHNNRTDMANGVRFETRIKSNASVSQNIWTAQTAAPESHNHRANNEYFGVGLHNSLGYLNDAGGSTTNKGFGPRHHWDSGSPGYVANLEAQYIGTPLNQPFPWLAWNDRPYNSPRELMTVPTSSPGRFLVEYGGFNGGAGDPYSQFVGQYAYLMNWFAGNNNKRFEDFMEFIEVPSPFVNTQELISPAAVQVSSDTYDPSTDRQSFMFNDANAWLRPPFNTISRFRNPGKVNLNMVADAQVWRALTWSFPNPNTANHWNIWGMVRTSRAGYSPSPVSNFGSVDILSDPNINFDANLNPAFASEFHGVFAPATMSTVDSSLSNGKERQKFEATLLRPNLTAKDNPQFDLGSTEAYQNANANPHFRYEGIQRLHNLTTSQSNVYAVWLTVGYFEVTPNPANNSTPDGYMLGQELGADDGSIERSRFFYIIDRSIPVGYAAEDDLNVKKVIRLERRID